MIQLRRKEEGGNMAKNIKGYTSRRKEKRKTKKNLGGWHSFSHERKEPLEEN